VSVIGVFGLFGCVIWWVGAYDLIDIYILPSDPLPDLGAILIGVAIICLSGTYLTHAGIYFEAPQDLSEFNTCALLLLYCKASVISVGGVFMWKGVYNILCFWTFPASLFRELMYTMVGLLLIIATNTMSFNAALFDPTDCVFPESEHRGTNVSHTTGSITSGGSKYSTGAERNRNKRRLVRFTRTISFGPLQMGPKTVKHYAPPTAPLEGKPTSFPGEVSFYFRATLAFLASFFFWTGVWNIFSDHIWDYVLLREMIYLSVGFVVLFLTGSLLGNAGITPISLHKTDRTRHLYHIDNVNENEWSRIQWISDDERGSHNGSIFSGGSLFGSRAKSRHADHADHADDVSGRGGGKKNRSLQNETRLDSPLLGDRSMVVPTSQS